ncbi:MULTISPECIES: GAF domain-containing protein [Myxococcaceae]|uniref:GAF domain-containing protein n=1 Tax=Myxococcaceae TaxID=31 RepID=UPI00188E629E|nr:MULTISPECIES: GAF domain-containing protein [Myxococcaceae]MBF5044613.1 GAF domain-containing protein [Simulacricoccus sp. 17bor-14]
MTMTSSTPPGPYAHFDAFSQPTLVVRAGEVVYVNPPLLALLKRPAEQVRGRPVWQLLGSEDEASVKERYQRRMRGEAVPTTYEVGITVGSGAARQVELTLERVGEDVVVFARDVTERAGRRQRMLELARLGTSLPTTAATEEAVLERLFAGLEALGLAFSYLVPVAGGRARIVRAWTPAGVQGDFESGTGHALEGLEGPLTPQLARAWAEGAVYADDYALEAAQFVDAPHAQFTRELLLRRGQVHFIVVRVDVEGAPRALLRLAGRWLRAEDLPMLRLFGAQVSTALNAARAIQHLSERNTALAALDRLATAAAAAPDPQGFFATGLSEVRGLLGCTGASLFLVARGARSLQLAHAEGPGLETLGAIHQVPIEGTLMGEVVRDGTARVVDRDVAEEPVRSMLAKQGLRTLALIPLQLHRRVVGTLNLAFTRARTLSAVELETLHAMGAHFAAAAHSHRLLSELRGRVDELSLLNDVARGLSTLEPVAQLTQAMERLLPTFEMDTGAAFQREGEELVLVAHRGLSPTTAFRLARLRNGTGPASLAARTGEIVVVDSLEQVDPGARKYLEVDGLQAVAAVPLVAKGEALGVLMLGRRRAAGLTPRELELLRSVGAQLGVALDSSRLFHEARRRAEDLAIVHEVGRSLTGTLELQQLLDRGVVNLARIVDAPDAYLFLADAGGERLEIRAAAGDHPELVGLYLPAQPPDSSLVARVFQTREGALVEDARTDPRVNPALRSRELGLGYLALPLVVRERTVGVAVISETRHTRRFTPQEVERAAAVANQLAVALDSARLYEDLKRSYAELARAHAQLVHTERLAALGELSAVVAHEVRNPLGAIFNSVASLKRLVGPQSPTLPLLEIVGEESERLNHIVNDLLEFARPAQPQLRAGALVPVLQDAVTAALAEAEGPVQVEWQLSEGLAPVPMDERLLRQALLNLAQNAVQVMPQGGRLHVRVAAQPGPREGVCVELTDSGPGVPPELRTRIFEPFFTTRAQGTGLGLALVKRIIESHAGSVEVTSAPDGGARFRVLLPVAHPARESAPLSTEVLARAGGSSAPRG